MTSINIAQRFRLLVIALLCLGLVTVAIYVTNIHSRSSQKTAQAPDQTKQAIDCSKPSNQKNLASIDEQTASNSCLFVGCGGFYQ